MSGKVPSPVKHVGCQSVHHTAYLKGWHRCCSCANFWYECLYWMLSKTWWYSNCLNDPGGTMHHNQGNAKAASTAIVKTVQLNDLQQQPRHPIRNARLANPYLPHVFDLVSGVAAGGAFSVFTCSCNGWCAFYLLALGISCISR